MSGNVIINEHFWAFHLSQGEQSSEDQHSRFVLILSLTAGEGVWQKQQREVGDPPPGTARPRDAWHRAACGNA